MKMSPEQFNSCHLWFRWVADALNENDIEMSDVIKAMNEMTIRPNDAVIKAVMWRPTQEALMDGEGSITQCTPAVANKIYDHLNRLLSNLDKPIHVPFPDKFDLAREKADKEFYEG